MTNQALTPESTELGRSLRDRFFELSMGSTSDASSSQARRFRALVDATDTEPALELDGLSLSYHPSARFKALRFVDADRIDARVRHLFARPSTQMPHLAAVFVDPEELSYRTFENILPLDRWFEGVELDLELRDRRPLGPGFVGPSKPKNERASAYAFTLHAGERARAALEGLDSLNLYVAPTNTASRGGKRFIFHAARLSEALGEAVRAALPKRWLDGFSHVNPVFRCNRFEPGDAKFRRHVDTPYYDAARKHVSRYTMLIYLTGGRARPALQIADEVELETIDALTCVVFRQDLEHEGSAYEDGAKLFLRTELVFADASVTHEPGIAQLFAKACYLTGESMFEPQLARRAHELYDRAAAAHWSGLCPAAPDHAEPYFHKRFRGIDFVTNGYDYWFAKQQCSLRECAAIAVLDLLNCKVGSQAFRKLCTSEILTESVARDRGADAEPRLPSSWVPEFLAARSVEQSEPFSPDGLTKPVFAPLDLRALFPPSEEVDEGMCCPFHSYATWDATRGTETVELYERAQRFAKRRIAGTPITMMGQEIFLDLDKIVIEGGKIHMLSDQALAPVNFAACWNDGSDPSNYLDVEVTVEAPHLLVPPILFVETGRCFHLMLDMFRNSWMVSHQPRAVPVPKLRNVGEQDYDNNGDWEGTPWLDAASREFADQDDADDADEDDADEPWWSSEESPVIRELYADD